MNWLYDKLLIFICCFTLYLVEIGTLPVMPILISIGLSCMLSYYDDRRVKLGLYLIFIALCQVLPFMFLFLPLFIYEIVLYDYQILIGLMVIPLYTNFSYYSIPLLLFIIVFSLLSTILKYKTFHSTRLQVEYNDLRDTSTELSILQKEKNQSLLENQDYEINVATLNERNRISKDIHDNIGHLLSRSLLQIGALLTITKEETVRESLTLLKDSISEGMDSIRNSIHNIHDESIDLYTSLDSIVKEFTFCPISFEYDIKVNPQPKLKYSFIAITKEALSNIIKHSNGTKVSLILREHPAMYQFIISDNGRISESMQVKLSKLVGNQVYYEGIGLQNIIDRVKGFDGQINISTDLGFKIFITIPKKQSINNDRE